jgi:hypothetical protein
MAQQGGLQGLDTHLPSPLEDPAKPLTCVHLPQGHQDPKPTSEWEADLVCVEYLLDGRESLKAEGGGVSSGPRGAGELGSGFCRSRGWRGLGLLQLGVLSE